jgi:hypothetical protein
MNKSEQIGLVWFLVFVQIYIIFVYLLFVFLFIKSRRTGRLTSGLAYRISSTIKL